MRRIFLAVALGLITASAAATYIAARMFAAPGPLTASRTVVIPRGGLDAATDALLAQGVIRGRTAFRIAAAVTSPEGPIHAGELEFPKAASLRGVLAVLRSGRPVQHRVTFAEGLTAAQISQMLARNDALAGDLTVPPEGAVLPETYVFDRGTTRAAIVEQAEAAMDRRLQSEWAQRSPGLSLHSAREALILASIVEHEARLPTERPMIARVFLNRLAMGMRLQADPTAAYVAGGGLGHMDRALTHADLEDADPYNTYVIPGLPAGPICSPGLATIHAVLHPATGDALYFVADGTGGHLFTDTLAAHDVNVAHLRARRP
jgi:UPF0755 protein